MDIELITEAKELRKEGLSFKDIGVSMGITKSKARYLCSLDINEVETKIKNHVLHEEEICSLVPKCNSINEIIKILGHKGTSEYYKQIQKIINKYNLDTSHFGTINNNTQKSKKRKIEEILIEDIDISISKLRDRLIKEGIKEYKCEECGLTEWNNKPIPLQLHHINGNRRDNRLENLQILCPNCHAQTDNHSMRKIIKEKNKCIICGCEIGSKSTYCKKCFWEEIAHKKLHNYDKVSKVVDKETLVNDFKEIGSFTGIGKKYNVSDNTIKSWCIKHGLPSTSNEIRKLIKTLYPDVKWKMTNGNKYSLIEYRKQNYKPKAIINESGEIEKIYNTTTELIEDGFDPSAVWGVVNGKNKTHKGKIFIEL